MALLVKLRAGEAKADAQSQSPIARLPQEIRSEIYSYVYPEHLLHVKRHFSRNSKERLCDAYWCVELDGSFSNNHHRACNWAERPKKHMLGLPLTCRQLYMETVQLVYRRHTFHMLDDDLMQKFAQRTSKVHLDALTSLSLTYLTFDPDDYDAAWELISSLSTLRQLSVTVGGCETDDSWDQDGQQAIVGPVKKVQQETIEKFDLIFDIGGTWFPDDCYMKINYNGLHWDTFTFDMDKFPAFNGIHPRCRVIGMNGLILHRPLRDDMPTQNQLENWFSWFSCNSAYGYLYPDGYDTEEIGEQASAQREKEAAVSDDEWDRREAEGQKLRDEFETAYMYGDDTEDDPEKWDLAGLNRAADLQTGKPREYESGRWVFPDKPSWIEDGTLQVPHEFPSPSFD